MTNSIEFCTSVATTIKWLNKNVNIYCCDCTKLSTNEFRTERHVWADRLILIAKNEGEKEAKTNYVIENNKIIEMFLSLRANKPIESVTTCCFSFCFEWSPKCRFVWFARMFVGHIVLNLCTSEMNVRCTFIFVDRKRHKTFNQNRNAIQSSDYDLKWTKEKYKEEKRESETTMTCSTERISIRSIVSCATNTIRNHVRFFFCLFLRIYK